MSLFQRNPSLLERVAAVLGAAPMLSEHLARYPSALEGLLSEEAIGDPARMLRTRLADTTRLEDAIQVVRRAVKSATSCCRSRRWRGGWTSINPGASAAPWRRRRWR